ncbi:hypothetical protein BDV96DRAFT_603551 [Lophiotrema nucula]|uniref:Cyanovirin-N domain-containing protein n=1 Tax=Lophiotrema nucula TaxID=690887 RepID=A0A6A5YV68_9PLEO|nr:hypothetical protein BDV96DRAFT_603551 [Lophiotrema nucula]
MLVSTTSLLTLPLVFLGSIVHAVPALVPRDSVPSGCDPTCEFLCTKYTAHTLSIDGTSTSGLSASRDLKVTFDNVDVCPNQHHECSAGTSCDFRFHCNDGWSFYLKDQAMQGPWSYDLQGLPFDRYYTDDNPSGNMDVSQDDINCDGYGCGGGLSPLYCRFCLIHSEHKFWTAEKTCDLPSK